MASERDRLRPVLTEQAGAKKPTTAATAANTNNGNVILIAVFIFEVPPAFVFFAASWFLPLSDDPCLPRDMLAEL
ncbi:MAG: hypothetical protein C4325_13715 [Blastocatellia bacterium]